MDQLLAMQHRQHRQQLAQQQHHLPVAEDQLAFTPRLDQLPVGATPLPLAHQPEIAVAADHLSEAGDLGVKHPRSWAQSSCSRGWS